MQKRVAPGSFTPDGGRTTTKLTEYFRNSERIVVAQGYGSRLVVVLIDLQLRQLHQTLRIAPYSVSGGFWC